MKAIVEIKLGKVAGINTVQAVAREENIEGDEFGVRHYVKGDIVAGFDMTVEKVKEWRSKNGGFGRLYFHALKELKARLEMQTQCKVCDRGKVYFRKLREGTYLAQWNKVDFHEHGVCKKCNNWFNPVKSDFNPHPELEPELEAEELVASWIYNQITGKDAYFPAPDTKEDGCVNELRTVDREDLLEDIDYQAAIDVQATREFMGTGASECKDEHWMWVLSAGAQ